MVEGAGDVERSDAGGHGALRGEGQVLRPGQSTVGWGGGGRDASQHNGTTRADYKASDTQLGDNTYREVMDAPLQVLLMEGHLHCPSLTHP